MPIKTAALILLLGRIVSVFLTVVVVKKQLALFKIPIRKELQDIRIILFVLVLGVFVTNIIPSSIDVLTLTSTLERSSSTLNPVGVMYAFNACLGNVLSSIVIWVLYIVAAKLVLIVDNDKYEALQKK